MGDESVAAVTAALRSSKTPELEDTTMTSPDDATGNSILICPGQGAQHVGMGKEWAEHSPGAAAVLAEADDVLGIDLRRLCFDGPAEELNRTDVAQAAIYAVSVACHAAIKDTDLVGQVVATAGLSLGEFTALHLAGAFDFESGLRLVRLRGQAMQDAADASDGSMVALIGAEEDQARELCSQASDDQAGEVLVPANFNCPGQIVVSGSRPACDRAVDIAGQMELRATPLTVAGAFHSPLMKPAADRLAEALEQVDWRTPAVPVMSNVTGEPHDAADVDSIKRRLVEQLTSPVRWSDCMAWAIGNIPGLFVETAPGKVLAGLMKRIDRSRKVQSCPKPA